MQYFRELEKIMIRTNFAKWIYDVPNSNSVTRFFFTFRSKNNDKTHGKRSLDLKSTNFKNWIEWKVSKGVTNPLKEYIQWNSVLWLFYDSPIGLIRNLFNIMRKKPHNSKIETHNHHNWECNWCHAWHQSFRSRKVSKHIRLRHKSSSLLI